MLSRFVRRLALYGPGSVGDDQLCPGKLGEGCRPLERGGGWVVVGDNDRLEQGGLLAVSLPVVGNKENQCAGLYGPGGSP
jgi:hypothetical protein